MGQALDKLGFPVASNIFAGASRVSFAVSALAVAPLFGPVIGPLLAIAAVDEMWAGLKQMATGQHQRTGFAKLLESIGVPYPDFTATALVGLPGIIQLVRQIPRLLQEGYRLLRNFRQASASKTTSQLEFDFAKDLENPNFVLYKASEFDPSMLRQGEYTLNLPFLRNEALDWEQNQQALQRAMNIGKPIREANPNTLGGWLQRERDFLGSSNWLRTQQGNDVFWVKPSSQ